MKIKLFGLGFEAFELPQYVAGVTTLDSQPHTGNYPVKQINSVYLGPDGSINFFVALLEGDEHRPVKVDPLPVEELGDAGAAF